MAGRPGWCRRTTSPTSARSTSTATASPPSPPSTAAPARSSATSSPSAGSACRAAADRRIVRGLPGLTLDPEVEAFRAEVRGVPRRRARPGRAGERRDFTDLTGWDEAFERDVVRAAGAAGFLGVSLPGRARRRRAPAELAGGGQLRGRVPRRPAHRHRRGAGRTDGRGVRHRRRSASSVVRAACAGTSTRASRTPRPARAATCRTSRRPADALADATAASCSTARRCSSPARTRPTGAARSRAPIRSSTGKRGLSMFLVDMATPGVVGRASSRPRTGGRCRRSDSTARASTATPCSARSATAGASSAARCSPSAAAWRGWAGRPARSKHCSTTASGHRDRVLRDALADLVTRWFAAVGRVERVLAMQDAGAAPFAEGALSKVCVTELLQRIARVGGGAARPPTRSPHRAGSVDRSRSGSPTRWWSGSTRR